MEKIGDRELLMLSWTDSVVNSSKIRQKKIITKKSIFTSSSFLISCQCSSEIVHGMVLKTV